MPFALLPLLIGLLPQAAGLIGRLIAGNTGEAVAQDLTSAVLTATGTANPADARAHLDANPEAVLALKVQIETLLANHVLEMAKLDLERDRVAAANTADARASAVATLQAGGSVSMRDFVAGMALAIFPITAIGSVVAIMFNADPLIVALVNIVVGQTGRGYGDTINYFLGSSLSSANKEAARNRMGERSPG